MNTAGGIWDILKVLKHVVACSRAHGARFGQQGGDVGSLAGQSREVSGPEG